MSDARAHLESSEPLLQRMAALMQVPPREMAPTPGALTDETTPQVDRSTEGKTDVNGEHASGVAVLPAENNAACEVDRQNETEKIDYGLSKRRGGGGGGEEGEEGGGGGEGCERDFRLDARQSSLSLVEDVMSALPTFSRRYATGHAGLHACYVNDELGSAFRHSETPNCQVRVLRKL